MDISTKVRYSEMNMPKIPTLFRKFGFEKQLPITVRLFAKQRDVLIAIGRIYGAAIKRQRGINYLMAFFVLLRERHVEEPSYCNRLKPPKMNSKIDVTRCRS